MNRIIFCLVLLLGFSVAAPGAQKTITLPDDNSMAQLKPGQGAEVAHANCVACHSTDYIVRQPGRDPQQWDAELKKMITVFGAPINESDAKVIVNYLATAYGPSVNQESRKQKPAGVKRDRCR